MGRLRFIAPGHEAAIAAAAPRGFIAGLEGIPWQTKCTAIGEQLLVDRETSESGTFCLPWHVAGRGELMLSTSNLMEREEAYLLPLELARGTVCRLRSQAAAWQQAGLNIPTETNERMQAATQQVAQAAVNQHRRQICLDYCELTLQTSLAAIDLLGRQYGDQVLTMRREQGPLPSLFGARLESPLAPVLAERYLDAFNAVSIPFSWNKMEPIEADFRTEEADALLDWARQNGLKVCGGPLVSLDARSLPHWLTLYEEDPEELQSLIFAHVNSVVNRYRGKVQLWNVAARMNVDGAIKMGEEESLRLTVDCIELVRTADPRTPMIVSFDQPWSEHLGAHDRDLPPLNFADTLARAELGVAGFAIEFNWGYWPHATPERDAVELSRLIDRWSMLGLPLLLQFTAPSGSIIDPQAKGEPRVVVDAARGRPSLASQREFVERLLPVCLAKNSVQAIIWNAWSDADPHEFPHGGLVDRYGRLKPAIAALSSLRKKYLQ